MAGTERAADRANHPYRPNPYSTVLIREGGYDASGLTGGVAGFAGKAGSKVPSDPSHLLVLELYRAALLWPLGCCLPLMAWTCSTP
jgi:hypothetical protein